MKIKTSISIFLALIALSLGVQSVFAQAIAVGGDKAKTTEDNANVVLGKVEIGNTKNVTKCGDVFLAGQFEKEDIKLLKEEGINLVITLRTDGEVKWDEKSEVEKEGINFLAIPFRAPDSLTDEVFQKVRDAFKKNSGKKIMLHCGSANRVGAVWAAYRSLDQGLTVEDAIAEGKKVGLRTEAYVEKAKDYIQRQKNK